MAQIDVSEVAREAEVQFPVYLTRAVWESSLTVPDGVRRRTRRVGCGNGVYAALRGPSHERPRR